MTATVVNVQRREEPGLDGPMIGLDAQLHVCLPDGDQHSYFLSRLADEPHWCQDAHFGPNGHPNFSHGFGSRYLRKQGVHPALEALLDEAARNHGLVASTGPGVPLTLAS